MQKSFKQYIAWLTRRLLLCSASNFPKLLLSVRVAQLRLKANNAIISIISEYLYNNRTDVLWFLALLHKVNKGDCLQIQTYGIYYSNREVIQNFVLKYSKKGFYCDLTWNKVYPFPVNFRKVEHIQDSVL